MKLVYENNVDLSFNRKIYLICVFRDEDIFLPYFIEYYKKLGISHFLMVNNNSIDESNAYLSGLDDVNIKLFLAKGQYRESAQGMDWVNELLNSYCKDEYCLIVDADELFVINSAHYSSLYNLVENMEANSANVMAATLLDMYPKVLNNDYRAGENFLSYVNYFDKWNDEFYRKKQRLYNGFNWLSGGLRERTMATDNIISKFPFFKFDFNPIYLRTGCHFFGYKEHILASSNNIRLIQWPGILLHFKFLRPNFIDYLERSVKRNQHWHNSIEYRNYLTALTGKDIVSFYDSRYSMEYKQESDLDAFWNIADV